MRKGTEQEEPKTVVRLRTLPPLFAIATAGATVAAEGDSESRQRETPASLTLGG